MTDTFPLDNLTAAQRLAAELSDEMEAILERIGGLQDPHPSTAGQVRGARTVSREFIASMIMASKQFPEIEGLGTFNRDEAEAMLQFNDAFRIFANQMAMMMGRVRFTMEARKADVAAKALSTFAVMKGMVRDPRNKHLGPTIEVLTRDLGRKGRRKPREESPV
jgi:uncharacterized membrane protein